MSFQSSVNDSKPIFYRQTIEFFFYNEIVLLSFVEKMERYNFLQQQRQSFLSKKMENGTERLKRKI